MAKRTHDELLDHEYDGIREYDNPCPAWWHLLFTGSVIFSVFYFIFFQIGPNVGTNGWTVIQAHDDAEADNLMLRFSEIGELTVDEATMIEYMGKPDWLKVGASVFARRCQSCHAPDGSGKVGPNMTDDHYKNVKQLIDIAHVIENGAGNGNMPAWRNQLHVNEVVLVAAYVANMRGTYLPGKEPEGQELTEPWPTSAGVPSEEETKTEDQAQSEDEPATDSVNQAEQTPDTEEAATATADNASPGQD